ncbi:MAG: Gfo/Idh/MocA family oxidoreductase [Bryobacteraceae bacterium]|nr:Gfo/Idh/MocA family oxidoreductase [Bryobacterales bacterium]MEB2361218.1 Gfo/Idh/MocA family oxidoreductase [Bryobacterales bacterium]NUN02775.1 Gfo/Idh/MocA family oxidoreductase [Bryobacteraceae bacterium]
MSSIASSTALFGQSSADTIGTGMIGTGNRGAYLLKTVLGLPVARVVAVCDIKPDRLDKAATAAAEHKPKTYTDYRRLLEDKDVEAVYIATPCDLHVEMAIAALQAGKHVYCEKPVGITPESIGRLLEVARNSNKVFVPGQQMRSIERIRQTIEKIQKEGVLGKVIMVKAQRHAADDLDHEGSSADWFFNAKRSGDVIVEMAVHNLDLCNWVIGSRPARAGGFGGALLWKDDPPGRTNMDGYTLSYDYENDVKMSFTQVFFHPNGLPSNGQFVHVYGTEGAVDLNRATFYKRARKAEPVVLVPEIKESNEAHMAAFFEAIRTGKQPPADMKIGAIAALTAIMGREAIYQKRLFTWNEMGVNV